MERSFLEELVRTQEANSYKIPRTGFWIDRQECSERQPAQLGLLSSSLHLYIEDSRKLTYGLKAKHRPYSPVSKSWMTPFWKWRSSYHRQPPWPPLHGADSSSFHSYPLALMLPCATLQSCHRLRGVRPVQSMCQIAGSLESEKWTWILVFELCLCLSFPIINEKNQTLFRLLEWTFTKWKPFLLSSSGITQELKRGLPKISTICSGV